MWIEWKGATDSYIDDILVNETEVTAVVVIDYLKKFELNAKLTEWETDLEFRLKKNKVGELDFQSVETAFRI